MRRSSSSGPLLVAPQACSGGSSSSSTKAVHAESRTTDDAESPVPVCLPPAAVAAWRAVPESTKRDDRARRLCSSFSSPSTSPSSWPGRSASSSAMDSGKDEKRELRGVLARIAWNTVRQIMAAAADEPQLRPGWSASSRPSVTASTLTLTLTRSCPGEVGPGMITSSPSHTSIRSRPRACSASMWSDLLCSVHFRRCFAGGRAVVLGST